MPEPCLEGFREDVVPVARIGDPSVELEQAAAVFGVRAMSLSKWMRRTDIDTAAQLETTGHDSVELRKARRQIKLIVLENEILCRGAAHLTAANLLG
ncbi:hypothetical protein [Streptomyces cadmiisoli]|uniref:Transposase n=1 Tax=Streptomyces cadmiisoli TaxID=2184053 RepID=A0A2Z4JEG1_9ACTN|nr:hypothetical protein [Streptomyces cadmiisoli]AWW43499.1 hypothetical protein DN051_43970 [Streptomyces cadmiisoli]